MLFCFVFVLLFCFVLLLLCCFMFCVVCVFFVFVILGGRVAVRLRACVCWCVGVRCASCGGSGVGAPLVVPEGWE